MDSASVVPGIYSETARATEFEISHLRARCEDLEPDSSATVRHKPDRASQEVSMARLILTAGQTRVQEAMKVKASNAAKEMKEESEQPEKPCPQGDLARAIQEKLGKSLAAFTYTGQGTVGSGTGALEKRVNFASQSPDASPTGKPARPQRPTRSFSTPEFYDGPWTSKFTAAKSPGALNRWNEQRPDVGHYKIQYGMVLDRQPAADFAEHPKHKPRSREQAHISDLHVGGADDPTSPMDAGGDGTFSLTGIDSEADSPRARAARRQQETAQTPGSRSGTPGYLEKTPNWDQYGKMRVGRYLDVHYNSHTEPAKDLYQQDIKGYPKQRPPEWDMEKPLGRQPLMKSEDSAAPGKYDVKWGAVRGKVLSGVPFDRALHRSQTDGQLGHFAPMGALQADEKRFPGGVTQDRSRTKDVVRDRITHVNDFDRELPRPNLPPASHEYHDKSDPVACEATLRNQLTYNADAADVYVSHRRDIAPGYERMLSRGKSAVQGLRSLQSDLGVRGSVGLGFIETTGQASKPVERLEGRASNAAFTRPDIGPKFEQYTQFQPLCMKNNFNHGHPKVMGAGPRYEPKHAPLQKARVEMQFKRKVAAGFTSKASAAGPKVSRQSRAQEDSANRGPSMGRWAKIEVHKSYVDYQPEYYVE
eukprot:gb/GFBE01017576.1/.p1 GENE.gb/GFBE01017576.1/~~gb/GFBE01017576.1/.p1  ORF type:complete len:646 (+),score=119.56 gb/GFBE01017576.1/:1-1938(+)